MTRAAITNSLTEHLRQIQYKSDETLFKRVNGHYIPVSDPWATEGLRDGWWLVQVRPGNTTIRQCIHPDKAPIEAAARELEHKLVDVIRAASLAQPAVSNMTPELKQAWDELVEKFGDELNTLKYPSFVENAQKIINHIINNDI